MLFYAVFTFLLSVVGEKRKQWR